MTNVLGTEICINFMANFVTNVLGTEILIKFMANLCPDADSHNCQKILVTYCFGENAQCHNFSKLPRRCQISDKSQVGGKCGGLSLKYSFNT